jgi:hypothetical protein
MVIYTRVLTATLLLPLVLGGVVGCSTLPSEPSTPHNTDAPSLGVVMTEQEALDAAQKAYGEYLAMSDLIAQEGGVNPERLMPFVTEANYSSELNAFQSIQLHSQHLEGKTEFDSMHIQNSEGEKIVTYLCLDVSQARLLNSDNSVVSVPALRWPLIVRFATSSNGLLAVDGSETWTGTNFC